jgi:hypothetical protein
MPQHRLPIIALSIALSASVIGCTADQLNLARSLVNSAQSGAKNPNAAASAAPKPALDGAVFQTRPGDGESGLATERRQPKLSDYPGLAAKAPTRLGQRISADRARRIAAIELKQNVLNEPNWANAAPVISAEKPLALYDGYEEAPAYFEFAVTSANQKKLGHITVATSPYNDPVPDYSTRGGIRRKALIQQFIKKYGAEPVLPKFYRFSAFSFALEDASATDRVVTRSLGAFDFARAKAGKQALLLRDGDEQRIDARWREVTDAADKPFVTQTTFRTQAATSKYLSDAPYYYQHDINSGRGCAVGCGPVAWSLLYGWYQVQKGINAVPGDGRTQTSAIEAMHEKLRSYCGTFCWPGAGNPSATIEGSMYLGRKYGRNDRSLTVSTDYDTYWTESELFSHLQDEIDAGRPTIMLFAHDEFTGGVGNALDGIFGEHYTLATGYYKSGSTKKIAMNTGWEEDDDGSETMTLNEDATLDLMAIWKVRVSN